LDPIDVAHATKKRSHSYGHPPVISEQMDNCFPICRPAPVTTSIDKECLSQPIRQFQLPLSVSRSCSDSECTWEGELGNISRNVSPSSSVGSSVSNEYSVVTSTLQAPAETHISCEVETSQESYRQKIKDMLANDAGITLMIRNLPNKVLQCMILQKLAEQDLHHRVRLVYVPVEFGPKQKKKTLNKGFAFIHTNDRKTADTIIALWHRTFAFGQDGVTRSLNIARAHKQGLMQNVETWSQSATVRIRNPHYSPLLVMEDGKTISIGSFKFCDLLAEMKDAGHTDSTQLQSQVPTKFKN